MHARPVPNPPRISEMPAYLLVSLEKAGRGDFPNTMNRNVSGSSAGGDASLTRPRNLTPGLETAANLALCSQNCHQTESAERVLRDLAFGSCSGQSLVHPSSKFIRPSRNLLDLSM